jgi:hypoxanthine phosphoribosyltransferase
MTDRSGIVRKYAEAETKLFMTLAEAEALSIELAMRIRRKAAAITDKQWIVVGIANGGLMVAKIVAETLGFPFEPIRIQRSGTRLKRKIGKYDWVVRCVDSLLRMPLSRPVLRRLIDKMNRLKTDTDGRLAIESGARQASFKGNHIILVDDCINSGQTIQLAKKTLLAAGAKDVLTGVLTVYNSEKDQFKSKQFGPLVYLNTRIHHYPWSQNNNEYDDLLYWLNERGIKPWL